MCVCVCLCVAQRNCFVYASTLTASRRTVTYSRRSISTHPLRTFFPSFFTLHMPSRNLRSLSATRVNFICTPTGAGKSFFTWPGR